MEDIDLKALQEIANNGALLNQALNEIVDSLNLLVLPADHGGTGHNIYAVGDILYADSTTTLARLPDVAVGSVLISGGVNAPPSWGGVPGGSISGVVPVENGGTERSTLTANNLLAGDGTDPVKLIAPGSNGNFLASNGTLFASSSGATAAEYRANTSTATAIRPAEIWNSTAVVALSDAATIAIDMSTGFNFSVTITANRTLGNPTNAKVGQSGCIAVTASGSTRTINVDTNWYATTSIPLPISIASGQICYIFYFVYSASVILVTGALNNPT
jgi:hypothetical protein